MKCISFAKRNTKEILRDKINLAFGIGFPVVTMLLLSAIQANIPVSLFEIDRLTPGIIVFGFSFISLFSGTLIAKDRTSSYMLRLLASPLTATDFILGYTLPLLPMAILQSCACFIVALFLGLSIDINIVMTLIVLMPAAVFFIAIGLLAGSVLNDKQVGGVCGALLTNLSAWLSGTWFDIDLVGGAFKTAAYLLPFVHSVNAARAALSGDYAAIFPDLWWVIGYAFIMTMIAIFVFKSKMKNQGV